MCGKGDSPLFHHTVYGTVELDDNPGKNRRRAGASASLSKKVEAAKAPPGTEVEGAFPPE